jgi:hypothetical protein
VALQWVAAEGNNTAAAVMEMEMEMEMEMHMAHGTYGHGHDEQKQKAKHTTSNKQAQLTSCHRLTGLSFALDLTR